MTNLTTQIWYSNGTNYTWPEQVAGVQPNVGICFPGGGTRALSATMGQLRGLLSFGGLNGVDYISCVSGGSWASTAFAYYKAGATSDEEFLGPVTEPANITLDGLSSMPTSCMGWGATQDLGDAIDRALHAGVREDLLWAAAIGQVFFERFGLYDMKNPSYFSLDEATVAQIKAANPSLADASFQVVREPSGYKMPYLLINATIDGPTHTAPYNPDQLVMISYSPLYAGIPFQQTITYPFAKSLAAKGSVQALLGGGFIEPFAWGCDAPAAPAPAPTTSGTVSVGAPDVVFEVANASGTSSSAFAAILEKIKLLDKLLPEQNYWPPVSTGTQPPAQLFDFGDGGNLENYGLLPLIMRGVKKVLLFINTETPLSLTYDPTTGKATTNDLDSSLTTLFGIPVKGGGTNYNHVFPATDFAPLVQAMQALKQNGQPMVVSATHSILPNPNWGIPGGGSIEVLYFYLDQVQSWTSQIKDGLVRDELKLGDLGEFAHFPNYKTIDETLVPPWSLTELSAKKVNLLADLTCWVVRNSQSTIQSFIGN
jgi:hypothetical protein